MKCTRALVAASLSILTLACTTMRAAERPLVAPGAKLEKIAGGFVFTEGASADAAGNVYFTDQPNDRIMKYSVDGRLTEWMKPCGRSNGTKVLGNQALIACADEKNQLWSIDLATQKVTVILKDYQGKLLNGPNDVWIRPDGGMYFTDPFYKRDYWNRGPSEQPQCVYFISPDRGKVMRVIDDLKQPNGIVGTPDGKTLYVADIGAGRTFAFDVRDDGTLSNKRLFCKMGSDGMTLDVAGNVYLTGRGVSIFDRSGQQVERIDVPENWCGNLCFGGQDRQTLFITASKGFYAIRMSVKGAVFPGG